MKNYIKIFNDISINDISQVGGKNASLGEMFCQLSSKGILVPDGFAVTAEGYWSFLDHNKIVPQLNNFLPQPYTKTFNNLSYIGSKARKLLLEASFPL